MSLDTRERERERERERRVGFASFTDLLPGIFSALFLPTQFIQLHFSPVHPRGWLQVESVWKEHGASRPQKPLRLVRDGEVWGGGREFYI